MAFEIENVINSPQLLLLLLLLLLNRSMIRVT